MSFPTYVPATGSTVPAGVPAGVTTIAVGPTFTFSLWDTILLGFVLGLGVFLAKPIADLIISHVSRDGLATQKQLFWAFYLSTVTNLFVQYLREKGWKVNQPPAFDGGPVGFNYANPGDFKVHHDRDAKRPCNSPRKRRGVRVHPVPTYPNAVDVYQIIAGLSNASPEAPVVPQPSVNATRPRAAENTQQATEVPRSADSPPDNIADDAGSDVVVVPPKK